MRPRVAFCGDSNTFLGTLIPGGWCYQVRDGLQAHGMDIVILGAGRDGDTTATLAPRWLAEVDPYRPQWATCMIGTNDYGYAGHEVPVETYRDNLAAIVNHAEALGQRVILMTPPRFEDGVGKTLSDNEGLYPYVAAVRELAASRPTVTLADINAAFLRTPGPLTYDGTHVNDAGHALVAQTVIAAFVAAGE